MRVLRERVELGIMKRTGRIVALIIVAAAVAAPLTVQAQPADQVPKQLEQVGVTEHPDVALPFDAQFVDESGRTVRLGDYFSGDRPVILTLNYYECPMLCGLQLNGLVDGLEGLDWTPGQEFEIVTISINPLETPTLAKLKKQNYIKHYGRPQAASGWHFLTGREADIRRVADTVGFGYRYDPEAKQYAHPAVMFVATPKGHVARYLYGIELPSGAGRGSQGQGGQRHRPDRPVLLPLRPQHPPLRTGSDEHHAPRGRRNARHPRHVPARVLGQGQPQATRRRRRRGAELNDVEWNRRAGV